jgi:hypothetical protein
MPNHRIFQKMFRVSGSIPKTQLGSLNRRRRGKPLHHLQTKPSVVCTHFQLLYFTGSTQTSSSTPRPSTPSSAEGRQGRGADRQQQPPRCRGGLGMICRPGLKSCCATPARPGSAPASPSSATARSFRAEKDRDPGIGAKAIRRCPASTVAG